MNTWRVTGCEPLAYEHAWGDPAPCCGCAVYKMDDPRAEWCECRCHDAARIAYRLIPGRPPVVRDPAAETSRESPSELAQQGATP